MLLGPLLAAVTLWLSEASEAELRSIPQTRQVALDLTTTPSATLSLIADQSELSTSYSPTFGLVDMTRRREFVWLHSGTVGYAWWTRRLRLNMSVVGTFGRQSYLAAAETPAGPDEATSLGAQPAGSDTNSGALPAGANFLPQTEVLETASLTGTLGTSYALSRRWLLGLGVAYEVGGGLGDSEQFLPFRRGPSASVSVGYQLTRRDDLTTALAATLTDLPQRKGRFFSTTLLETWAHRFAPRTQATLGAGATYLQARASEDAKEDRSVLGTGLATLSQGIPLQGSSLLSWSLAATLGTGYNRVLGLVNQQAGGSVSLAWTQGNLSLGSSGQATQALPVDAPDAARSYGAGATASYQAAEPLLLLLGANWTHQVLPEAASVAGISADQWQAYIGVSVSAPPITF